MTPWGVYTKGTRTRNNKRTDNMRVARAGPRVRRRRVAEPTDAVRPSGLNETQVSTRVLAESTVDPEDSPRPSRCVPSLRFSRPGLKARARAGGGRELECYVRPAKKRGDRSD